MVQIDHSSRPKGLCLASWSIRVKSALLYDFGAVIRVSFMLRQGHISSELCLPFSSVRNRLLHLLSWLFAGYAMAARLRAGSLKKPEFSTGNCLTYVISKRVREGGKIILIKSLYGWWCHAYWLSETGEVFEYAPVQPHRKVKKLWHPLPPLVYEGRPRLAPKLPQTAVRKIHAVMQPHSVPLAPGPVIITARAQNANVRVAVA